MIRAYNQDHNTTVRKTSLQGEENVFLLENDCGRAMKNCLIMENGVRIIKVLLAWDLPAARPVKQRASVRMPLEADARAEPKGYLCAQISAFNLHAARRVAPSGKPGKPMLCRYILRPPLANERLHLSADGSVTVEFKRRVFHSLGASGGPWTFGLSGM